MTQSRNRYLMPAVAATLLVASLVAAPVLGAVALDQPTFVSDVAPILHRNCASCHSPGEIGPMPLRTWDEVRPWAKSIAKAVANRDMPPWDADPGFGPFVNDISLADAEVDLITRWVAAGAPRGDGDVPPPPPKKKTGEWTLGEPDFVFEFDPIEVPGDGPDQFHVVPFAKFDEDRWIEAVEILPGDPKVVHHFILWRSDESGQNPESWMSGWAAGAPPNRFPEGTARLVPKGRSLLGDFHYHPYGEATTDRTRIGIHFADPANIQKEYVNLWVLNADFKIPAGDPNYGAKASYVFPQDVQIRSLAPHMHYRGKDMKYTAVLPDGTSKELLKVSRYDFNWQTGYDFVEPVQLPAGSRIDVVAHWDNSENNPHNPDPTVDVTWGPQSTDEMLIGFVDYVVEEGVSPKPVSLVLGKLAELAEAYPGQVWRVDVERVPGKGAEPSAVHLPKSGGPGGWYVQFGSLVLPAPIQDVVWDGNKVTAKALIPGQAPMEVSGVVDPSTGDITLTMGGGSIQGTPAEREAKSAAVLPPG
jgi:mono/diheme cytochrome c family protein